MLFKFSFFFFDFCQITAIVSFPFLKIPIWLENLAGESRLGLRPIQGSRRSRISSSEDLRMGARGERFVFFSCSYLFCFVLIFLRIGDRSGVFRKSMQDVFAIFKILNNFNRDSIGFSGLLALQGFLDTSSRWTSFSLHAL